LIYRLVIENLKHRPVRTFLSAVAIGIQVTMLLTLVGVSHGMLDDMKDRSRGMGADIMVRAPNSSLIGLGTGNMPEGLVNKVREEPHVTFATGTLNQGVGNLDSIAGIHLDEFDKISGGFHYVEPPSGSPFQGPHDLLIDDIYARAHKLHVGGTVELSTNWRVSGVVESGKLSRMFADITTLQDLYAAHGQVTVIWVKVDDPQNIQPVIASLRAKLSNDKIYTMEEFTSLVSVDRIPQLKDFIGVVIGLGIIVGFLVVFDSTYTAVLERTREIGILKALGASPGYILRILLLESVILAAAGTVAGILMTFGTQKLMHIFVATMTQEIVPEWWPWAALISLAASLGGAFYPGLKAARQDAIEALSYD